MGNQVKKMLLGMFAAALALPDRTAWSGTGAATVRRRVTAEAEGCSAARWRHSMRRRRRRLNRALTVENLAVMLRAEGRYEESEKLHLKPCPGWRS